MTMQEVATKTLMLALQALVKDRAATVRRLDTEELDDDERDELSDRVLDLTTAMGDLADAYDAQRAEGPGYPTFDTILERYDVPGAGSGS